MGGLKQRKDGPAGYNINRYRSRAADGVEFIQTPPGAVRSLLAREKFEGTVWEPACGSGKISEVLLEAGLGVVSTDKYDHGYGRSGVDFLLHIPAEPFTNIITNPPFTLANEFIERACLIAPWKVAMLLKMDYLRGIGRGRLMERFPPARVYVFALPLPYYEGDGTLKRGSFSHCWFVWDNEHSGPTQLVWILDRVTG